MRHSSQMWQKIPYFLQMYQPQFYFLHKIIFTVFESDSFAIFACFEFDSSAIFIANYYGHANNLMLIRAY